MATSLRTLALLMLAAGASVGIFAGTLIAGKEAPIRPTVDERVEERVKAYREFYGLDIKATDAIRRELQWHRRALTQLVMDLRRIHQDEFSDLVGQTEQRIEEVLRSAGVNPDSGKSAGATDR